MARIESGDNKIPDVGMDEKIVEEAPSPYKAGLEKLSKLPRIKDIINADYVENFKKLSKVNLEIRKLGPNPERLLAKDMWEKEVKNYKAAALAANNASGDNSKMDARKEEAYFDEGEALLLFAMEKAGVIVGADSVEDSIEDPVQHLLQQARDCFAKALELDPADDEAKELLDGIDALLESPQEQR